jgi:hypothetical protein
MNLHCQASISSPPTHTKWHSHHHSDQERVLEPRHTEEIRRVRKHNRRPAQRLRGDPDGPSDCPAEVGTLEDLGPGRSLGSAVVLPLSLDGISDSGVLVVL